MIKKKILVVDDEADIRELIRFNLRKEGFDVFSCADGENALEAAIEHQPSLILLDVMLPGIDGIEVCSLLKGNASLKSIPIVMLSAKTEESDQLVGLKAGADDYLLKPFSPKVLVAKITAILRRADFVSSNSNEEEEIVRYRDLVMNPNDFSVMFQDAPLKLTVVEYKILYFLARRPGRVYSRARILEKVRGDDVIITERTVDVHVLSLRRKLGDAADMIETVRGIGYRVKE
jgi:two-component system, OmpR family, alkaline phosphatase synthesis response regulator PhoP